MHFTSKNGLDFQQQAAVNANLVFANSQQINDQHVTYGFYIQEGHQQHRSSLYYTTTKDGYEFTEPVLMLEEDKELSNNLEEFMLKEPVVIQLEDESFLMFYLTGFSD
ncbi:hypothetical protein HOC96_02045 [archaeon]|nr:hypothetical protein [archaeon]